MFLLAEKYTSVAKMKRKPLVRSVLNSRKLSRSRTNKTLPSGSRAIRLANGEKGETNCNNKSGKPAQGSNDQRAVFRQQCAQVR